MKNRYYIVPPAPFTEGHPVRIATVSNRKDRYSVKNAIGKFNNEVMHNYSAENEKILWSIYLRSYIIMFIDIFTVTALQ